MDLNTRGLEEKGRTVYLPPPRMCAVVAQLVRAPDCGSGGQRFNSTSRYHASFSLWPFKEPVGLFHILLLWLRVEPSL